MEGPGHAWRGSLRAKRGRPSVAAVGTPRIAPKKQLGKAQVRAMVRIQMRMLRIKDSAVGDDYIDALFDRFDVDKSGLMDDAEWDSLAEILEAELLREAQRPQRSPRAHYLSLTDARLARVMADAKKPPRHPDPRIHKPGRAATRIQAAWRGFWVRWCLKAGRMNLSLQVMKVQALLRGHRARQEVKLLRQFSEASGTPGLGGLRLPPQFVPATAYSSGFVPPLQPEAGYIVVAVPSGMCGGDTLQLTSADGRVLDVDVPPDLVDA